MGDQANKQENGAPKEHNTLSNFDRNMICFTSINSSHHPRHCARCETAFKSDLDRRTSMSATPEKDVYSFRQIGSYKIIKTLGRGSTGKVKLAINLETDELAAIKIIPRKISLPKNSKETIKSREQRIYREVGILRLLDHPNVVKLIDFYENENMFCLVFEYIDGSQLLEYIIQHGGLKEKHAKKFFVQLIDAVHYCHLNAIVHRDLKIENVMIEKKTGRVVLVDFGLANFYQPFDMLHTFCGSLYFAAPELLSGKDYNGPEVDVWSLGVILYVMLTGRVPFDDRNIHALHAKIKKAEFIIPGNIQTPIKELLAGMICKEPSTRLSLQKIAQHEWINHHLTEAPERLPLDRIDPKIVEHLSNSFSQFQEIEKTLQASLLDWALYAQHPIIKLYFLTYEYLKRKRKESSPKESPASNEQPFEESVKALTKPANARPRFYSEAANSQPLQPRRSLQSDTRPIEYSNIRLSPSSVQEKIPARDIEKQESLPRPRTLYLRGIFGNGITKQKSMQRVRQEVEFLLSKNEIQFEAKDNFYECFVNGLGFEIHLVRVAYNGLCGVQLKRRYGSVDLFKSLQKVFYEMGI